MHIIIINIVINNTIAGKCFARSYLLTLALPNMKKQWAIYF